MKRELPRATHEGEISLGRNSLSCAVLEDGTHLVGGSGFLRVLGLPWRGKLNDGSNLGVQIGSNLRSFNDDRLREALTLIEFRSLRGQRAKGLQAYALTTFCNTFIRAREDSELDQAQLKTASQCDHLLMLLGEETIEEQIDAVTGFDTVRDRLALHDILRRSVSPELMVWIHRIPDDFFRQVFRLRGWEWKGMALKKPKTLGRTANSLIFERLAPGVVRELREHVPEDFQGRRKNTRQPWLTKTIGHQALENHVYAVVGLMRASANWSQFYRMLQRSFPKEEGGNEK